MFKSLLDDLFGDMENSQTELENKTTRQKIFNFFEHPKGFWPWAVQIFILICIIISVWVFVVDFFYRPDYVKHEVFYEYLNHAVLVIFTVEYLLRIFTAPNAGRFFIKPLNLVDFLAIFPNYVELLLHLTVDTAELRVFRLIRILRFTRVLRAFRIFHFEGMFKKVFSYHNTIFQAITPVIAMLAGLKLVIWFLEAHGFWFSDPQLGDLFAIIGFALGIILSQKIAVSYGKFVQVEETVVNLEGNLRSLEIILNKIKPAAGTKAAKIWATKFLQLLEDPTTNNSAINIANIELYDAIYEVPSEFIQIMAGYHSSICQGATLALSKKIRLTPKAYDTLLQQSTVVYLILIALFIPTLTGLISVLLATYILYGMYHLTEDFDSILGGQFNLINIDISELKHLANS